jgi:D-alanyl-D-alanine carboxypeptidase
MVKLAEDGLISLDDPISKYLPDFPYADGAITIRQLLNHTSGMYMMTEAPDGPFRTSFSQIYHEKWWTIDEIFTTLGGEPYHVPGEGYCYTQAGYQIATLIVEEVTGSTIAEQIQTRLLDPLNIDGMYLDFPNPVSGDRELAHPWFDLCWSGRYLYPTG